MAEAELRARVVRAVDSLTAAALTANSPGIRGALAALADDLATIAQYPDPAIAGAVRRRAKEVALEAAREREERAVDAIAELIVAVGALSEENYFHRAA